MHEYLESKLDKGNVDEFINVQFSWIKVLDIISLKLRF